MQPYASWSLADAERILRQGLRAAGVPDDAAVEPVRMGENAIFRDAEAGVVLRVSRPSRPLSSWTRQLELVAGLVAAGAPLSRPMAYRGLPNPFTADGHTVTSWTYEQSAGAPTLDGLARALRALHAVPPEAWVRRHLLPLWEPLERTALRLSRLAAAGLLDDEHQRVFEAVLAELRESLPAWIEAQGRCTIHADAYLGNLVQTSGGAVLLDTDTLSSGPALWDAVPTCVAVRRFGLPVTAWEEFADGLGVAATSDVEPAVRLRELDMLLWLWQQRGTRADVDAELEVRFGSLLETREDLTPWSAF